MPGRRLENKIILVFGATGDIGKAISAGFINEGAQVIPASRNREKVAQTIDEFKKAGNQWTEPVTCDVTDESQIEYLCEKIMARFARIDCMVCASGAYLKKPAQDVSLEEWNHIISVNLTGVFLANKIVGKIMLSQSKGSIINIGSLGSFVSLSHTIPYCVSKSGVVMLTKCLSSEWCSHGVRVNAIIPGVFPTNLNRKALSDPVRLNNIINRTPMKRLGEVNELAGAAVYLASDESSFVTGTTFAVDGGFLAHSGF